MALNFYTEIELQIIRYQNSPQWIRNAQNLRQESCVWTQNPMREDDGESLVPTEKISASVHSSWFRAFFPRWFANARISAGENFLKTRWAIKRPGRKSAGSISDDRQFMVQMIWMDKKSPSIPSVRFSKALTKSLLSPARLIKAASASSKIITNRFLLDICISFDQKPIKSGLLNIDKPDGGKK